MRLLLMIALCGCGPKKPPPVLVAGPEDLTEETLNQLVAELIPLVEEAAGRPFDTAPHARLGRRADLEAILEAEFLELTAEVYDAPEWVLRQLASEARQAAPGVVGKWGIQTRVLYLSPEAAASVAEAAGVEVGDVARLVLAHEMTHGLQSEVRGWEGLRDADHIDAMRAVTEGHANFVEARVAERLGLEAARRALDSSQGWTEQGPTSPAAFELWALYGQGREFVAWHHAHGGNDEVWTLLREPPAATSMIFHPETYAPTVPDTDDFSEALDGVEEVLTEGAWVTVVSRVGELSLRQDLQGTDGDEVGQVLDHLAGGTERRAFRTDRETTLRVMRFEDADWARRMVDLAGRPRPIATPDAVEIDFRDESTAWDDLPSDAAVLRIRGPEHMGVGLEVQELWLARGDLVVAFRMRGFRPGLRLKAAVEALLGSL